MPKAMHDLIAPCAERARGQTKSANAVFPDHQLPGRDRLGYITSPNTGDPTCKHPAPVPRNQPRSCGGGVWSAMSTRHAARAAAPETAHIRQNPTASLQSKIDRVRHARAKIAQQITSGEEWMLPLLKRFNTELARLEETQELLHQATEIANRAAPHRAA